MIVWVLVAAAAVLLFWPASKPASEPANPYVLSPAELAPPQPRLPTYIDAVSALQTVRHRLVETEQLGEAQQDAIDAITLALVRGSER
jgi:hypothetical protein